MSVVVFFITMLIVFGPFILIIGLCAIIYAISKNAGNAPRHYYYDDYDDVNGFHDGYMNHYGHTRYPYDHTSTGEYTTDNYYDRIITDPLSVDPEFLRDQDPDMFAEIYGDDF